MGSKLIWLISQLESAAFIYYYYIYGGKVHLAPPYHVDHLIDFSPGIRKGSM